MTINRTLSAYGFQTRDNGSLFWGTGSLVSGHTVSVKAMGNDMYEVSVSRWDYDQYMEPIYDTDETRVLHGALALAWVFAGMPQSFWRRR